MTKITAEDYMVVHDAAQAEYEAATPDDYRYSAIALRRAVDVGIAKHNELIALRAHNSDSAEPVGVVISTGADPEISWYEGPDLAVGTELYLASPPAKEVERLREALLEIRELNTLPPDENGHRWDNSDLIAQTIMSALTNRTPDDE